MDKILGILSRFGWPMNKNEKKQGEKPVRRPIPKRLSFHHVLPPNHLLWKTKETKKNMPKRLHWSLYVEA